MNFLTKQEWTVLIIIAILLATGGAVKIYRAAHSATAMIQPAKCF